VVRLWLEPCDILTLPKGLDRPSVVVLADEVDGIDGRHAIEDG
jgi:hypothetical protein